MVSLVYFVLSKPSMIFMSNDELVIEEFHDIVYRDLLKQDKSIRKVNTLPNFDPVYKEKFILILQCYLDILQ